jgi:acyl-CoA thioesterase FadM
MITDAAGETLFFSATMVLVAINTQSGRSVPIPPSEKDKVIAYEPAL